MVSALLHYESLTQLLDDANELRIIALDRQIDSSYHLAPVITFVYLIKGFLR